MDELEKTMQTIGQQARAAAATLARASIDSRNRALSSSARALRAQMGEILDANRLDMEAANAKGLTQSMLDRLRLDESRVEAMALGLETIEAADDPVGRVMAEWLRPNGLNIQRVSVPLGVIGIIYESRPNVTSDAAALCLKSGNAVILRGGSESFHSSMAIFSCLQTGLTVAGISTEAIQMIPTTDRAAVGYLLSSMADYLDVVVPRGGKGLIERVRQDARVPVIGHLEGLCHVYLHESADAEMAASVTLNSKMRRTGICGSAETLLIDREIASTLLPQIGRKLTQAGCEIRGDEEIRRLVPDAKPAEEADWSTEYLDAIISIRIVEGVDAAIEHIQRYGSGHTESIVASDAHAASRFLNELDSAILLHNASTQFADGGEFGMGAEIGIATDRIHARGPVGAEQLTSYKYVVRGDGQVRP